MPASTVEPPATDRDPAVEAVAAEPVGRLTRWFGPMTAWRVLVLLVAVAFLGGAVGWAVAAGDDDPLSSTDVGFMQDMTYHHDQAVELSLLLLAKDDVDPDLQSFAQEILIDQRYEQGIFNATLDRYHHASAPGETVMAWMGPGIPLEEMEGLATDAQVAELKAATGTTAEALWIALMTNHHLGGLHMADWEARKGTDRTTRNIARAMVRTQRGEVVDLNRFRTNHHLPIPKGFSDPLQDQRLHPLSLDED